MISRSRWGSSPISSRSRAGLVGQRRRLLVGVAVGDNHVHGRDLAGAPLARAHPVDHVPRDVLGHERAEGHLDVELAFERLGHADHHRVDDPVDVGLGRRLSRRGCGRSGGCWARGGPAARDHQLGVSACRPGRASASWRISWASRSSAPRSAPSARSSGSSSASVSELTPPSCGSGLPGSRWSSTRSAEGRRVLLTPRPGPPRGRRRSDGAWAARARAGPRGSHARQPRTSRAGRWRGSERLQRARLMARMSASSRRGVASCSHQSRRGVDPALAEGLHDLLEDWAVVGVVGHDREAHAVVAVGLAPLLDLHVQLPGLGRVQAALRRRRREHGHEVVAPDVRRGPPPSPACPR